MLLLYSLQHWECTAAKPTQRSKGSHAPQYSGTLTHTIFRQFLSNSVLRATFMGNPRCYEVDAHAVVAKLTWTVDRKIRSPRRGRG